MLSGIPGVKLHRRAVATRNGAGYPIERKIGSGSPALRRATVAFQENQ
jgi:hypothetical protein